jgi:hypothetical protein
MKTRARTAVIIFLLLAVSYAGFANGSYTAYNNPAIGIFTKNGGAGLRQVNPGSNILSYEITSKVGGVIFQATAVPAGNAVGQPVTITYDSGLPDGKRLLLAVGASPITANLYDWEIIPIARFVESRYAACMTLYDEPGSPEEDEIEAENEDIFWADFHPAFGNTLIGLNLFFVDAMLINTSLLQNTDRAFYNPIPGYHDISTWRNGQDKTQYVKQVNDVLDTQIWADYIYTDYGTEISYYTENGQIKFNGAPSYIFLLNDHARKTVTVAEETNRRMGNIRGAVYNMNPTVYRSAEKTAQWAAFFRMVQTEYPQVWRAFMAQIEKIEPLPRVQTPRYWLSQTGNG